MHSLHSPTELPSLIGFCASWLMSIVKLKPSSSPVSGTTLMTMTGSLAASSPSSTSKLWTACSALPRMRPPTPWASSVSAVVSICSTARNSSLGQAGAGAIQA